MVVSHPRTNRAQHCLTSVIELSLMLPLRYATIGRVQIAMLNYDPVLKFEAAASKRPPILNLTSDLESVTSITYDDTLI